jgi:hypothetical protein
MVYFQTKDPNLGKIWRALEWKMLVYFMVVRSILWPFGNVQVIWYIFARFGILCPEKSGNPAQKTFMDSNFEAPLHTITVK